MNISQAARRYHVSRQTIYTALKGAGIADYKGPDGNLTEAAVAVLQERFTAPVFMDTAPGCQVDTQQDKGGRQFDTTQGGADCQVDTLDSTDSRRNVNQAVNQGADDCQVDVKQIDTDCQLDTPAAAEKCQVDNQQDADVDTQHPGPRPSVEAGQGDAMAVRVARLTAERDALAARVAEQARMIDTLTTALQEAQAATSRAQAITAGAISALQPPAITDGTENHRRTVWQRVADLFGRGKR